MIGTLIEQLNEDQKTAVLTVEGPLLVLAGAGSGKTRVVTFRIAHLLELGVPSSKILGVTFTNKAAQEMKERVHNLTNAHVLICTFHSLGARILRESIHYLGYSRDFVIYDESDVEKVLKSCIEELNIKDKKLDAKAFRQLISQAKNQLVTPEDAAKQKPTSPVEEVFPLVYERYQGKLKEFNAADFDDLLYLPVKLFQGHPDVLSFYQNRWSFLLIDEYQDTNASQYEIARMLVAKSRNLCVVGDPDQSIYSWRGADISNILNFEKDYPGAKVVRLEENYRSTNHILSASNAVISNNSRRIEKNLYSNLGQGEKIKLHMTERERDEANFIADRIRYHHIEHQIPLNHMVVFYRTHAQSRSFEDCFVSRKIPYVIVGGVSFYERREIKDVLAFLRIVHSNSDYISFLRTLNIPKRGLGDTTVEKLQQAASQEQMAIFTYCEALVEGHPLRYPVKLSAKQREGLKDYVELIRTLRAALPNNSLAELIKHLLKQSNYLKVLEEDQETFEDRKENMDSLIAKAVEWEINAEDPTLTAFLEELSLRSSLDEAESEHDRICLMTLHNGKGLEFDVAFLAGMEEDLFPHVNSRESEAQVEEERRLCYVGITRAKRILYLTHCMQRYIWGISRTQRPSRFIKEIPSENIEKIGRSFQASKIAPRAPEQVRFIDEMDQTVEEIETFEVNDPVFHKEFGIGVVRHISEGSYGLTYKILFSKDNRERTLVAKFAHLRKL